MEEKTLVEMGQEEFDALVDRFIERGEDTVTLPTFLQVMSDVAEQGTQRHVELTGYVINGEVIFDTPAPLPVDKNTLYIGHTKVVLKLRMEVEGKR